LPFDIPSGTLPRNMGSGSSSALESALTASNQNEVQAAVSGLSPDNLAKLQQALNGAKKPTVLFVLGGPGVGKGTQCTKIIENFSAWAHISAGDCLRAERNNPDSADGQLINGFIKEGKIVPVAITVKLLQKAMADSKGKSCFLIDGYPRNLDNVTGWEENVGDKANVAGVLFYSATEEELVKRLMGRGEGRDDDNMEVIKKRFKTYTTETMPIVELYKGKNQLISIDGMTAIDEVWATTKKCIQEIEAKA